MSNTRKPPAVRVQRTRFRQLPSIGRLTALLASTALPAVAMAQEAGAQGGALSVEEVVVTAEKRSASVVDTPVAVQVLSSDKLDKASVTNIYDIAQMTPGLRMDLLGTNLQPTIRGITSSTSGTGNSANIVIYVDGYYQPSNLSNNLELADVQQIEVVKGPQGTLFGRNATGGALLVTTSEPRFQPGGKVEASYGEDNDIRATLFATGPVNDILAVSGAVVYRNYEGFTKNIFTGRRDGVYKGVTLRGKVLFQPTDDLKFLFTLRYSNTEDGQGRVYRVVGPNTTGFFIPGTVVATEKFTNSQDLRPRSDTEVTSASLTTTYDIGPVTLTSYSSYQNEITVQQTDLDGTSARITNIRQNTNTGTLSQEFQLNSNTDGPLKWTAGTNYFYQNDAAPYRNQQTQTNASIATTLAAKIETEAYAVFADGTWEFIPNWFLTAGIRYSNEKKTFKSFLTRPPIDTSKTFDSLTPRVNLRYKFDGGASVYASYAKGFKSGTYNVTNTIAEAINPEKIDAFEVGYKMRSGPFSWNSSAYYYKYKDLQVSSYDFTVIPSVTKLQNVGKATIYGIDTDLTWYVTENFDVTISGAYTKGEYKDFPGAIAYTPNANGIGYRTITVDASGNHMMRSPEFTGNVTLTYTYPTEIGDFRISGNAYYTSRIYSDPSNQYSIDPYALFDLNASWTLPDEKWKFSVMIKNVFDKYYISYWDPVGTALMVNDGAPRFWRAAVTYKF